MTTGIRPGVWLAAGASAALAAGIAATALWPRVASPPPARPRAQAAAPVHPSGPAVAPPVAAAARVGDVAAPAPPVSATPVSAPPTAKTRATTPSLEETDPELAERLRTLEEEAAREAIDRHIVTPPQLAAVAAQASAAAAANPAAAEQVVSDAQRTAAADALIEAYLIRSEFRGTYPQDFPAETVLPQVVGDRLPNMSPQDRVNILGEATKPGGLDALPELPKFESAPPPAAGG